MKRTRPNWWLVFAVFPLAVGLLVIDSQVRISARGHEILEGGILFLVFGLMYIWTRANRASLSAEDSEQGYWIVQATPAPESRSQVEPMVPDYSLQIDASRRRLAEPAPFEGHYN